MEDKEAIAILTKMLTEHQLSDEEREALKSAIGIFAWTKLTEGYKRNKKAKQDRELGAE